MTTKNHGEKAKGDSGEKKRNLLRKSVLRDVRGKMKDYWCTHVLKEKSEHPRVRPRVRENEV